VIRVKKIGEPRVEDFKAWNPSQLNFSRSFSSASVVLILALCWILSRLGEQILLKTLLVAGLAKSLAFRRPESGTPGSNQNMVPARD
jgi:hypothetical protein